MRKLRERTTRSGGARESLLTELHESDCDGCSVQRFHEDVKVPHTTHAPRGSAEKGSHGLYKKSPHSSLRRHFDE